jgi:hypothetical protein
MKSIRILLVLSLCVMALSQTNTTNTTNNTNPAAPSNSLPEPFNFQPVPGDDLLRETAQLIPELANLTSTEKCVKKHALMLSSMSLSEQVLFYGSFIYQKTNFNDTTRCFAAKAFKKNFITLVKGVNANFTSRMTSDSKKVRQGLACISKTFSAVASSNSTDYKEPINNLVDSQARSNQCLASFVTLLQNTLNIRRKYLLLDSNLQAYVTTVDASGSITGFTWTEDEVKILTPAFIEFAQCYSAYPDALTSTIAEVQTRLANDPSCVSAAPSRKEAEGDFRFLQGQSSDSTNSTPAPTPSASSPAPTPSASSPAPTPSASSPAPTPSASSPPPNTKRKPVDPKKKNINTIEISTEMQTFIDAITLNLNDKGGLSARVSSALNIALANDNIKKKCDFVGFISSSLRNAQLIQSEYFKIKANTNCTEDYVMLASNLGSVGNGTLECTAGCNTTSLLWKSKPLAQFAIGVGCAAGNRFGFAYSSDAKSGQLFDFVGKNFNLCAGGAEQSNKCAKFYANLAKSVRMMQGSTNPTAPTNSSSVGPAPANSSSSGPAPAKPSSSGPGPKPDTNNCVSPMKATCQDAFNKHCKDTNLFASLTNLSPSQKGVNLPSACENIDPLNPDYVPCFTWIAKNLIRNSLYPRYSNIINIQSTIVNSQQSTLRYLQTDSDAIVIVKTDVTTSDSTVQLSDSEFKLVATDAVIDGSNADTQADSTTQEKDIVIPTSDVSPVSPVSPTNNNGTTTNSTLSAGYLVVSSFLLFIVALVF